MFGISLCGRNWYSRVVHEKKRVSKSTSRVVNNVFCSVISTSLTLFLIRLCSIRVDKGVNGNVILAPLLFFSGKNSGL